MNYDKLDDNYEDIIRKIKTKRHPDQIYDLLMELPDTYKIKYLNLLPEGKEQLGIMMSMDLNDTLRLRFIKKSNNVYIKQYLAMNMEDTDMKIRAINYMQNDQIKAKVIKTLPDDEKIQMVEKLKDLDEVRNVLDTVENRDKIKENLEYITDEEKKAIAISNLIEDEDKIELLSFLQEDMNKAEVIASFIDQKEKLQWMKELKHRESKALVLFSIYDKELLKKIFSDIDYEDIGLPSDMTIGIEIESEGINSERIKRLRRILNGWNSEEELSLKNGVEVNSPILRDKGECVQQVYLVCKLLKDMGQFIDSDCGGHVHIGANYLDSKEAYTNLLELWCNNEKSFMIMCNGIGEAPRKNIGEYANTLSDDFYKALQKGSIALDDEENLSELVEKIKFIQKSRNSAINFIDVNSLKNTIEFRAANGTINPITWIYNIRLLGSLVKTAKELADIENRLTENKEVSKEALNLLKLKSLLKTNIPEEEGVSILLKLMFKEKEEDINIYKRRYFENTKKINELPPCNNPLNELSFSNDKIDFEK